MTIEKRQCLKCLGEMSYIAYGYPSESLVEMCKENGWILGGCNLRDIDYLCRSCGCSWSNSSGHFDPSKEDDLS